MIGAQLWRSYSFRCRARLPSLADPWKRHKFEAKRVRQSNAASANRLAHHSRLRLDPVYHHVAHAHLLAACRCISIGCLPVIWRAWLGGLALGYWWDPCLGAAPMQPHQAECIRDCSCLDGINTPIRICSRLVMKGVSLRSGVAPLG